MADTDVNRASAMTKRTAPAIPSPPTAAADSRRRQPLPEPAFGRDDVTPIINRCYE
jgi:hypothetical protein